MKKTFSICILLLLFVVASFAQDATPQLDNSKKNVVLGTVKFVASTSVGTAILEALAKQVSIQDKSYMPALQAGIARGLSYGRRIMFKEMPLAQLKDELAAAGDDTPIYEINATVSNLGTRIELKKDVKYYTGFASVTLSLKNVLTNEVVTSPKFAEEYTNYGNITAENVVNQAIGYITYDVAKFLNNRFPVSGSIIEPGGTKKDKQKEVYVNLANNWRIPKGEKMAVYSVKTIAGREARKNIGTIKVTEVMGDDVSLCKVTKGGDVIKAALDGGEKVVVICY